jgi:ribokinase
MFQSGPGGKGANQAFAAHRAGGEVVFVTAVGDDPIGREALERYRALGIDVSHARVVAGCASGVALIFVGERGENMIGVAPGANDQITPDHIERLPESVFDAGGVFLASLEVPVETVEAGLRRARAAGMTTVLNPAPSDVGRLVSVNPETGAIAPRSALFSLCDLVTPNQEEALSLTGFFLGDHAEAYFAAEALRGWGVREVIVTLGAEGCMVLQGDRSLLIPSHPVEAVDTVGAGDAFNGALAVALAEKRPLIEAAAWACAAGALAVARPGAQGASPSRAEIDALAARAPSPYSPVR